VHKSQVKRQKKKLTTNEHEKTRIYLTADSFDKLSTSFTDLRGFKKRKSCGFIGIISHRFH